MRIGIILTARWWRFSINLEELGQAFAALGHEVTLVCRGDDAGGCEIPLVVASPQEEISPAYWAGFAFDVAVCFTNMREPATLRALREAGTRIISRADSDGHFSHRVSPGATFLRQVHPASNAWDAVRRMRHLVNCYLKFYREIDSRLIEVLELSHAVAIETEVARQNLARFLRHYRREDLLGRVGVVPHAVSNRFLHTAIDPSPGRAVFCAGRWWDDQKNAPLLARTIRGVLGRDTRVRFSIAGTGTREALAGLAGSPQVDLLDRIPNEDIPMHLGCSRFILSSSRWEGHPISGLEALCCGRTVVATPIPGFVDMVGGGRFGRVSRSHRSRDLAEAVLEELDMWEQGARNPREIAAHWRPLVSQDAVARGILSSLAQTAPGSR